METDASITGVGPPAGCEGFTCIIELSIAIGVTYCVLLSNLLNLIVLGSTPSLRNCHGFLLISLSIADFGTGVFSALSIYPLAKASSSWPYGDALCLVTAYLLDTCQDASAIMLVVLSIERYIAVVHPLRYSQLVTKTRTLYVSLLGWTVCLVVYSAVFFEDFVGYMYYEQFYTCRPLYGKNYAYSYSIIFGLALPGTVVILVTSLSVKRKLIKHRKFRAELTHASSTNQHGLSTHHHIASETGQTMKLYKMVRVMCIVFIVSWVPFLFLISYSMITGTAISQFLLFCTSWMVTFNSFLNAVIYYSMNKTFVKRAREIFKTILPKCCVRVNTWHRCVDNFCSKVCCIHGDFELRQDPRANSSEITPYYIDCELLTFSKQSMQIPLNKPDIINMSIL